MKATGIVRAIDKLGRVVIPKELRKTYGLDINDALEIYVDDEGHIILKKYEPACIFCKQAEDTIIYEGKAICKNCLEKINKSKAKEETSKETNQGTNKETEKK